MLPQLLAVCAVGLQAAAATTFNLTNFSGELADDSGVLMSLRPASNPDLDFSISKNFAARNGNGNYHTGDLELRWRSSNASDWSGATTAANRSIVLPSLPAADSAIASSDLTPAFDGSGLNVTRTWAGYDGDVVLQFNLTNTASQPVEIGGVTFPVEMNNILTGLQPEDALQECSFVDPYIGLDAGYVQVTQLGGLGPNMVVTPFVAGTQFEAWEFLSEDTGTSLAYQSTVYEGNYAWVAHSKAYADDDWAGVETWNEPTSITLNSGDTKSFGFRFTVVQSVTDIESSVASLGLPVAVGIPGYILPQGMKGNLYLNSTSAPSAIDVSPEGALKISKLAAGPSSPWIGYSVSPGDGAFGRARVTLTYPSGDVQALQYWISDESSTAMSNVGQHMSDKQWFTDTSDPFQRAPSIITYDKQTDSLVLQDNRVWIAGLSDEGGAGSFVVFSVKQVFSPVADEVAKLESFVNDTAWGLLQYSSGDTKYGVKRSNFYYAPDEFPTYTYSPEFNWGGAWPQSYAAETDRTYDYVWVGILYWSLYKANRVSPGILTVQEPTWYLQQAFETVNFGLGTNSSGAPNTGYIGAGLMGESMWGNLLEDLRNENMTSEASALESVFRARQAEWAQQADPYGSEQPWDCTAQEGVYYWSQYFNDTATAAKTISSIHGFDPAIPHWGYNGNARRYWDFTTAGNPNTSRIERQIHHYGSSLNAIPLLDYYRRADTPSSLDDLYTLRVGYGGHMASLSNIDADGFGSMAFHSFPNTLQWDTYTGDYGPSFVGHFQTAASYLVQHPQFGWVAFGGNLEQGANGTAVTVTPLDSLRRRAYVAPLGLYVELEAGQIESYAWDDGKKTLEMVVAPNGDGAQDVIMWFEQTSSVVEQGGVVLQTEGLTQSRGGYVVSLPAGGSTILQWGLK